MTNVKITIEGDVCSGKSLILRTIAPILKSLGHPVRAFEHDMEIDVSPPAVGPLPVRGTVQVVINTVAPSE